MIGIIKELASFPGGLSSVLKIARFIREAMKGAKTLKEARERIAQGVAKGDLDSVLMAARKSDQMVSDFLKDG